MALQLVDAFAAADIQTGTSNHATAVKYMNKYAALCEYKKFLIPPFGGVVFASDILHAGVENHASCCTMRGFCQFQGNMFLGFNMVETVISKIHHPPSVIRSQDRENICLMVR